MDFKIKICGMKYPDNYTQVSELQPDYIGLIFYKNSPRYMRETLSPEMLAGGNAKKVGVFVNASKQEVESTILEYQLDAIQLHGNELPEYCLNFKDRIQVIKAFSIHNEFDFKETAPYENACDQLLFDTKGSQPGGNGFAFNWEKLNDYDQHLPFFLSGGIGLNNINEAINIKNVYLYGIDVNSGVEVMPGVKDVDAVKQIIEKTRTQTTQP